MGGNMNFTIDAGIFKEALAKLGVVKSNSTVGEVIKSVKMEFVDGKLLLQKTDLNSYIFRTVDVVTSKDITGVCLAPYDLLHRFISILDGEIHLYLKDNKLYVESGKAKSRFQTLDVNFYPNPPKVDHSCGTIIPTSTIRRVIDCDKVDASRAALHYGVHVGNSGVQATDGSRAMWYTSPVETPDIVLVPSVLKGLDLSSDTVTIYPVKNEGGIDIGMSIQDGLTELITRSMNTSFPALSQYFEVGEVLATLKLDSLAFGSLVKNIRSMSDNFKRVRLDFKGDTLFMFCKTDSSETKMEMVVTESTGLPEFSVSFNSSFLYDATTLIDGANINFIFRGVDKGAFFENDSRNAKMLVMPMSDFAV